MPLENISALNWDSRWKIHFEHYQQDLRHGFYIRALISRDESSVLEIAAGSFRDMAMLNRLGVDCSGVDFSEESVARAKETFPLLASKIHCEDAFNMSFDDKAFDLSFHNGLWVNFSDSDIDLLLKEQVRITRKRIIATVHNKHNKDFFGYFEKMKQKDDLYNVRFFSVDEMKGIMETVCNNVVIIPVGKGKKHHEDLLIRFGLTSPLLIRSYLLLSSHRFLDTSERLLCIGNVKNV